MVILEFYPDLRELPNISRADLADPGLATVLQTTDLELPVRLRVGDVDLFAREGPNVQRVFVFDAKQGALIGEQRDIEPSVWLSFSILHMALLGPNIIAKARWNGSAGYDMPDGQGYLIFTRAGFGSNLTVRSHSGRTATAPYTEFVAAFNTFAASVRAFLNAELPMLKEHPALSKWLGK